MFLKKRTPEWLIVFLGNPGEKYVNTRHNVGFLTADVLERKKGIRIKRLKYGALTAVCDLGGVSVMLMKPQTYMNLSGEAAAPAAAFYKIPIERIIVVSDDTAIDLGKLRIRRKGSAGGHNGLKSLISKLGSDGFPRVKIGIGAPENPDFAMADWVLGHFRREEKETVHTMVTLAAEAVETIVRDGVDAAMNQYN